MQRQIPKEKDEKEEKSNYLIELEKNKAIWKNKFLKKIIQILQDENKIVASIKARQSLTSENQNKYANNWEEWKRFSDELDLEFMTSAKMHETSSKNKSEVRLNGYIVDVNRMHGYLGITKNNDSVGADDEKILYQLSPSEWIIYDAVIWAAEEDITGPFVAENEYSLYIENCNEKNISTEHNAFKAELLQSAKPILEKIVADNKLEYEIVKNLLEKRLDEKRGDKKEFDQENDPSGKYAKINEELNAIKQSEKTSALKTLTTQLKKLYYQAHCLNDLFIESWDEHSYRVPNSRGNGPHEAIFTNNKSLLKSNLDKVEPELTRTFNAFVFQKARDLFFTGDLIDTDTLENRYVNFEPYHDNPTNTYEFVLITEEIENNLLLAQEGHVYIKLKNINEFDFYVKGMSKLETFSNSEINQADISSLENIKKNTNTILSYTNSKKFTRKINVSGLNQNTLYIKLTNVGFDCFDVNSSEIASFDCKEINANEISVFSDLYKYKNKILQIAFFAPRIGALPIKHELVIGEVNNQFESVIEKNWPLSLTKPEYLSDEKDKLIESIILDPFFVAYINFARLIALECFLDVKNEYDVRMINKIISVVDNKETVKKCFIKNDKYLEFAKRQLISSFTFQILDIMNYLNSHSANENITLSPLVAYGNFTTKLTMNLWHNEQLKIDDNYKQSLICSLYNSVLTGQLNDAPHFKKAIVNFIETKLNLESIKKWYHAVCQKKDETFRDRLIKVAEDRYQLNVVSNDIHENVYKFVQAEKFINQITSEKEVELEEKINEHEKLINAFKINNIIVDSHFINDYYVKSLPKNLNLNVIEKKILAYMNANRFLAKNLNDVENWSLNFAALKYETAFNNATNIQENLIEKESLLEFIKLHFSVENNPTEKNYLDAADFIKKCTNEQEYINEKFAHVEKLLRDEINKLTDEDSGPAKKQLKLYAEKVLNKLHEINLKHKNNTQVITNVINKVRNILSSKNDDNKFELDLLLRDNHHLFTEQDKHLIYDFIQYRDAYTQESTYREKLKNIVVEEDREHLTLGLNKLFDFEIKKENANTLTKAYQEAQTLLDQQDKITDLVLYEKKLAELQETIIQDKAYDPALRQSAQFNLEQIDKFYLSYMKNPNNSVDDKKEKRWKLTSMLTDTKCILENSVKDAEENPENNQGNENNQDNMINLAKSANELSRFGARGRKLLASVLAFLGVALILASAALLVATCFIGTPVAAPTTTLGITLLAVSKALLSITGGAFIKGVVIGASASAIGLTGTGFGIGLFARQNRKPSAANVSTASMKVVKAAARVNKAAKVKPM